MRSLVDLAEERPEAVQLMRGRTFRARSTDAAAHARGEPDAAIASIRRAMEEATESAPDRRPTFCDRTATFPHHQAPSVYYAGAGLSMSKHLDDPQHRFEVSQPTCVRRQAAQRCDPGRLIGRLENLVTGRRCEFTSAHELLRLIVGDIVEHATPDGL